MEIQNAKLKRIYQNLVEQISEFTQIRNKKSAQVKALESECAVLQKEHQQLLQNVETFTFGKGLSEKDSQKTSKQTAQKFCTIW